jgi:hypothetical protein
MEEGRRSIKGCNEGMGRYQIVESAGYFDLI